MKKWHRRTAFFTAVAVTAAVAHSASGALIDMAGHWSSPLIAALEAKGIVAGDPTGRYDPEAPLTRAELAKLLVVSLDNEADAKLLAQYGSRYSDIPSWHWAKGYIESMAEMAVAEGYPDGSFGPADTVTRAQMAAFMARVLGKSVESRQMRLIPTTFADDAAIPDWARGYVHVAVANDLMNGFAEGTFRPQSPVSKAEAGVMLLRLLNRLGRAYHLAGTLVRFDAANLQGVVRDELGQEQPFTMAPDAQYYRNGLQTQAPVIRLADQVWVVLGSDGKGRFLEARYTDFVGKNATVDSDVLSLTGPDGLQRTFHLQRGAEVFRNGQPATLAQLQGAPQVYLALDGETGDVRIADAVDAPIQAVLTNVDPGKQTITGEIGAVLKSLNITPGAVLFLNQQRVKLQDLRVGDRVHVAVNDAGDVTYLQAER